MFMFSVICNGELFQAFNSSGEPVDHWHQQVSFDVLTNLFE